jgi:hypothetical protein
LPILFPGSVDVLKTVATLRCLADDLERMSVFTPGESELEDAPVLQRWSLARRGVLALVGDANGHPNFGPGAALTSELFAVDGRCRWARTFSRFYRLADFRGTLEQ